MLKIERTVTINTPVDRVFEYVSDPRNLPEIWPSLIEVKDVRDLPNGGKRFAFTYKMAGFRFEGFSEDVEYVRPDHLFIKTTGGVESTFLWKFVPMGQETTVTLTVNYTIPGALLGKLAEPFIARQNEHENELLLNNLKLRLEQPAPTTIR
ncbi:MAG TPA: SRPBCC family protein [Ktedonobacterales bacterium]|jgi:uncharacterized membrane protein|nr:SRPBCC family protein [Ktedonobacterales bacterium]